MNQKLTETQGKVAQKTNLQQNPSDSQQKWQILQHFKCLQFHPQNSNSAGAMKVRICVLSTRERRKTLIFKEL